MKKSMIFIFLIFSVIISGKENFILKSEGIVNNVIDAKYGGKGTDIIKGVGADRFRLSGQTRRKEQKVSLL